MALAIEVDNLTYAYPNQNIGLEKISFSLNWGDRLILVGPNGSGKSTLLRCLSGKTLTKNNAIKLNGKDPFKFLNDNITTYLGTEWILNSVIKRDMPVTTLVDSVGINQFPERKAKLVEILDIDLDWNMNRISDGQRRRVQLLLKIFHFWEILLLDEVTVDLDVLVRLRLLKWLKHETLTRKCCVIYATHIFDGLASLEFPTHLAHMNHGKFLQFLDYNNDIEFVNRNSNTDTVETHHNSNNEEQFNDIEEYLASKASYDLHLTQEKQSSNGAQHARKKIKISNVHSIHPLALQWLTVDYKNYKFNADQNQQ